MSRKINFKKEVLKRASFFYGNSYIRYKKYFMEELQLKPLFCSNCESEMKGDNIFCTQCGFPEKGNEEQRSRFHARRVLDTRRTDEALKHIKSGRNSLFVIAAIAFLFGLVYFFSKQDTATFVTSTILAIFYILLGFWSQKKPLMAFLLAGLLFLTTLVTNALIDSSTIYQGIILKIFIIFYLYRGVNSALELRNLRKA